RSIDRSARADSRRGLLPCLARWWACHLRLAPCGLASYQDRTTSSAWPPAFQQSEPARQRTLRRAGMQKRATRERTNDSSWSCQKPQKNNLKRPECLEGRPYPLLLRKPPAAAVAAKPYHPPAVLSLRLFAAVRSVGISRALGESL